MSQALCFNNVQFDVIPQNSQPWVRGYQIGTALGYGENADVSIRKLYTRHADEFTPAMTAVITLPTEGGPQETRIFSLRGCHLLAMFARTPVAKQFRRWVLDVIEQYGDRVTVAGPLAFDDASRPSKRTDPERKALTAIINTWVGMAPIHYASARAQVNAHFGVASVDSLTIAQIREAIRYVQNKIDALPAPSSPALLSRSSVYADRVKALHELENRFMQFEGETRSRFSEIEREYRRINQGAFADMLSLITSIDQGARDRLTEALVCHSYESYRWIDEGLARMRVAIITARAANRTLAR